MAILRVFRRVQSVLGEFSPISEILMWETASEGLVLLDARAVQSIQEHLQHDSAANEAGGLLIGYYRGTHLHIVEATTPKPKDNASRYRFERCDPAHIDQLEQRYQSSGGMLNLLGEWHTHPEKFPTPSGIDLQGWRSIQANRRELETVFLIAGLEEFWMSHSSGPKFKRVSPYELIP